jgi:SulP family sulfate permease
VSFPPFTPSLILKLLSPAVTVAMLGAIESLMSAVVADRMSGDRHNPNVELIAQGVANIASPMFGGLPATGAIARTAKHPVRRQDARSPAWSLADAPGCPAAGASLAGRIPMAVLAAILFVCLAHGRNGPRCRLAQGRRGQTLRWLATFALTVSPT